MRSRDVRTEECRNLGPTSRRGNFAKYARERESRSPGTADLIQFRNNPRKKEKKRQLARAADEIQSWREERADAPAVRDENNIRTASYNKHSETVARTNAPCHRLSMHAKYFTLERSSKSFQVSGGDFLVAQDIISRFLF